MSLDSNLQSFATRVATEFKTVKTLISGLPSGDLSGLTTTAKTSLLAAINELDGAIDALTAGAYTDADADARVQAALGSTAAPAINQWTSTQDVVDYVAAQVAALIGAAPGTLDTLEEIANALGNNATLEATLTASIAEKVSYAAAQTLTGPQQAQARANIGAVASADIGPTNTDYVAIFNAGLL